jgi:hypothetical protein
MMKVELGQLPLVCPCCDHWFCHLNMLFNKPLLGVASDDFYSSALEFHSMNSDEMLRDLSVINCGWTFCHLGVALCF